jgi:hypothetical protein
METSSHEVSDEELERLWKSPDEFQGAFSGVHNFKKCLKLYKGISVPEARLRRVMRNIPLYLRHIVRDQRGENAERRHFSVTSSLEV